MAIKNTPGIRDLKHRVALCSAKDVVTDTGSLVITREDVLETWAKIESRVESQFNKQGDNLDAKRTPRTHVITIRFRRDIDVTSTAWIYEARAQSGARWFKVLGIRDLNEDSDWLVINASLLEKGIVPPPADEGATEAQALAVVSHGVKL